MRKIFLIVCFVTVALVGVGAQDSQNIYMGDAASQMDGQTYETFCFLTGIDALAQNKAQGGLLAFTEDFEYLAGWATDETPQDFFISLPSSTLSVARVLPVAVAEGLFLSCSYSGAYPILEEYGKEHDYVIVVVCFKLYDSIVLEDLLYYKAKENLEGCVTANGLEIAEFYDIYKSEGTDEKELVERVLNGESSSEIVLSALAVRQSMRTIERKGGLPWTVIFLAILFFVVVFLFSLWSRARKLTEEE